MVVADVLKLRQYIYVVLFVLEKNKEAIQRVLTRQVPRSRGRMIGHSSAGASTGTSEVTIRSNLDDSGHDSARLRASDGCSTAITGSR